MSEEPLPATGIHANPSRLWKTILSTLLLVLWIVFMLMVFCVVRTFFNKKLDRFFQLFHLGCCQIFSLRCHVEGEMFQQKPTLFLSNHVSYLDVFILGSVIPAYFIAKSEVASWPVLGWLAKVQNTLFFERNSRSVHGQLSVMTAHFNKQGSLILFPEGTSTEGEHVKLFKSSLLQAIEFADIPVLIQPVTLAYTHYKDQAMDRRLRDYYAWYGDMSFAPHFFSAIGMACAQVSIIFHPPVKLSDFDTRKHCAQHCWQVVAKGLDVKLNQ
jgi:1-acyl-sn-glycerol-3-phosphate acyltransferase